MLKIRLAKHIVLGDFGGILGGKGVPKAVSEAFAASESPRLKTVDLEAKNSSLRITKWSGLWEGCG